MLHESDPTLLRQWKLIKALSVRRLGSTVRDLAGEAGVNVKTIRRDLELLRSVGFPVREEVGDFGRKIYKIEDAAAPPLGFTYDEALALFFCRQALAPLAGTFVGQAAHQAFRKIRVMLGEQAATYVDRMLGRIHRSQLAGDYSAKAELIDRLMIGIDDCQATFITYHSTRSTEPVTYDVYPYGLIDHRGSLYLVGFSLHHDEIRHWKVDRMENAEVTKVRFQRPADFDLHDHFSSSFGMMRGSKKVHVRVRFAPAVARYIGEKRMHASQTLTRERDGSVIAEFDLSSLDEVRSWILSFGSLAEVLEPAELRDQLQAELSKSLALYSAKGAVVAKLTKSKLTRSRRASQSR